MNIEYLIVILLCIFLVIPNILLKFKKIIKEGIIFNISLIISLIILIYYSYFINSYLFLLLIFLLLIKKIKDFYFVLNDLKYNRKLNGITENHQYTLKHEENIIVEDLNNALKLLRKIDKPIISFFGSARVKQNSKEYIFIKKLSSRLAKEGYGVISGGGGGIMEAANSGAYENGAISIGLPAKGLTSERPKEKGGNIFTHKQFIKYMFIRRFTIAIKAEALIFAGGGIGTLDEFFENVMLIQNKVISEIPIIVTNKNMYNSLLKFLKEKVESQNYLSLKELNMVYVENDIDKILKIILSYKNEKNEIVSKRSFLSLVSKWLSEKVVFFR